MSYDPSKLTTGELLEGWAAVMRELHARDALCTNNNPVGDIAEVNVAAHYAGERGGFSQAGWDVKTPDGERIQVKGIRVIGRGSAGRSLSPIRDTDYDCVVVVVFDESFRVTEGLRITRQVVEARFPVERYRNARFIRLTGALRDDPPSKRSTSPTPTGACTTGKSHAQTGRVRCRSGAAIASTVTAVCEGPPVPSARDTRRYWVWVTGPDYYLEDDGSERADLDPGQGYEPGGWWTCHRETEDGDLVLLYRSRRKQDIAYLIETRSDAYSLLDDEHAAEQGWDYGCDYEVIAKFRRPLSLTEMRADPALRDWGALRAGFRRRVYAIPPDTWNHLLDRLSEDRTKVERRRRSAAKRYALERDIEDRLAADLSPFRRHGLRLELRARQHVCRAAGVPISCASRRARSAT